MRESVRAFLSAAAELAIPVLRFLAGLVVALGSVAFAIVMFSALVLLKIGIPVAIIGGAVWVVVKVLQAMGVIG